MTAAVRKSNRKVDQKSGVESVVRVCDQTTKAAKAAKHAIRLPVPVLPRIAKGRRRQELHCDSRVQQTV
jgi:hypothetical protein